MSGTLQDLFMYRHTVDGDPKNPVEQASRARYYAKMAIASGHTATVEVRKAPGSDEWVLHQDHTDQAYADAKKVQLPEKTSTRKVATTSVRKSLAELSRVCSTLSRGSGDLSVNERNILDVALASLEELLPETK